MDCRSGLLRSPAAPAAPPISAPPGFSKVSMHIPTRVFHAHRCHQHHHTYPIYTHLSHQSLFLELAHEQQVEGGRLGLGLTQQLTQGSLAILDPARVQVDVRWVSLESRESIR
jgi:hypothetical protein